MRDFSAENEVVALRRAVKLVKARRESDDAYDQAQTEIYAEINSLDQSGTSAAVSDLLHALVRVAAVTALQASVHSSGIFTPEQIIDMAFESQSESSIEHDPDDPLSPA